MQFCSKCWNLVRQSRNIHILKHNHTIVYQCRNATSKSDSHKYDLDSDKSWEADYIRKQKKYMERVENGEIKESFPSIFDSKKFYDLPHLIFEDKQKKVDVKTKKKNNIDPDFARPEVYSLLTSMSGFDLDKIFSLIKNKRQTMPIVKLLTDKQLQEERERIALKAKDKIAIPPVMTERSPINEVIETCSEINGHEHAPVVFTDVSEDLNDRERFVVIREVDGTLRKANWEERDRYMQVYFPKEGRKVIPPPMFDEENLKITMENLSHEEIMQRAEMQFCLDSAAFIRISKTIYDDVDEKLLYDDLRSTKYFGSMAFYLAKNKKADNLMKDMLKRKLWNHAADLAKLFALLHPHSKTASAITGEDMNNKNIIQAYVSNDSKLKSTLDNLLKKTDPMKKNHPNKKNVSK